MDVRVENHTEGIQSIIYPEVLTDSYAQALRSIEYLLRLMDIHACADNIYRNIRMEPTLGLSGYRRSHVFYALDCFFRSPRPQNNEFAVSILHNFWKGQFLYQLSKALNY